MKQFFDFKSLPNAVRKLFGLGDEIAADLAEDWEDGSNQTSPLVWIGLSLPNLPPPLVLQAQRDAVGYWEDIQAHVLLLIAISNIAQWS